MKTDLRNPRRLPANTPPVMIRRATRKSHKTAETAEQIGNQIRGALHGRSTKFRPCAFFDDRLDCIRVIARDCSVLETRINKHMTLLEDNYAESEQKRYVGFTVKGARHFCKQNNIDLSTPVDISRLLDAILANSPEPAVQMSIRLVARPLIKKEKLKHVDIPPSLEQPQPA
jgi:hypothetical protein